MLREGRRLKKEQKEEGHTWLTEKVMFELLEWKKLENLEGSRSEALTVTRQNLCNTGIFQVWCCQSLEGCFSCPLVSVCEQHLLLEGVMSCVKVTGRAPSHCTYST